MTTFLPSTAERRLRGGWGLVILVGSALALALVVGLVVAFAAAPTEPGRSLSNA
jgi:hypothetical protein